MVRQHVKMRLYSIFIILSFATISFSYNQEGIIELGIKKSQGKNYLNFQNQNFALIKNENIFEKHENYKLEGGSLLDLTRIKDGLYTIKLYIGKPSQEFEVIIDTGSFILWVPSSECSNCYYNKNKYNIINSKSLQKSNERLALNYISGSVNGNVSDDNLKISENVEVNNFRFLLSDSVEAPVNVDGILGLSRVYTKYEPSFSIINSLFNVGAIKRRIFAQKINGESESKFSIGNLPKEISDDMDNYTTCKTVDNNYHVSSFWTCNLESVLFSIENSIDPNNSYQNKKMLKVSTGTRPAIFDTGSNTIIAPQEFYEKFKDNYFKRHLDNKSCSLISDSSGSGGFRCIESIDFTSFPTLKFVFDNNYTYDVNSEELFVHSFDEYVFRIVFGSVPGNGWLLGQPFLKQYHIVFDQDNNTVGIYPLKKGDQLNKIDHLLEFELETEFESRNSQVINILSYASIYYIFGIIIGLLLILIVKIVNQYSRKNIDINNDNKNNVEERKRALITAYNPNNIL